MTADRRRTARARCRLPATWVRGHRRTPVVLSNLNVHGFFVETAEAIDPNFVMDVEIELPDGPVSLLAVARSAEQAGIGAQIFAVDVEDRLRLISFYRSLVGWGGRSMPIDVPRRTLMP